MNALPTNEITAKAIRVHLAYQSRSQRWLADQIGMTEHQFSRRMTGKTPFTTDDLDDVAQVLDVGIEQLLVDGTIIVTQHGRGYQ